MAPPSKEEASEQAAASVGNADEQSAGKVSGIVAEQAKAEEETPGTSTTFAAAATTAAATKATASDGQVHATVAAAAAAATNAAPASAPANATITTTNSKNDDNPSSKPPPPPLPQVDDQAVLNHRIAFYKTAYDADVDGTPFCSTSTPSSTSKQMTAPELAARIHALRYWENGDGKLSKKEFRKANHQAYALRQKFKVVQTDGKYRLISLKHGTVYISTADVFDAIRECHIESGACGCKTVKRGGSFGGTRRTYEAVKKKYGNVPEAVCVTFCRWCPVCIVARTPSSRLAKVGNAKNKPGAGDCIMLRNRYEVYLIDMRHDRRTSIYGTRMSWIMHIRDVPTKRTTLVPIPSKDGKWVAHEMNVFRGLVGTPAGEDEDDVSNTDFTEKEVSRLVRELNAFRAASCKTVKGIVASLDKEKEKAVRIAGAAAGDSVSWIDLLPRVMSKMNVSTASSRPVIPGLGLPL